MKRVMKNLLGIILIITMVFTVGESVFAADDTGKNEEMTYLVNEGGNGQNISTIALAECGRYATHDMLSRGWGTIRRTNGKEVVYMGACHQCTRCNLVLICQGEPECSSIGYYATSMAEGPVNTITVLTTDDIHYTSAKTIAGMDFRY